MRIDKDHTRRIGGLLLDLLMLAFIITFSLADVRITRGDETEALSYHKMADAYKIVSDLDSAFSSFQKQFTKILPEHSNISGVVFHYPHLENANSIEVVTQCLYGVFYASTPINAP